MVAGYGGRPALVTGKQAQWAAALSRLAWDRREVLTEIEINPIIVNTENAVAVDAVVRSSSY